MTAARSASHDASISRLARRVRWRARAVGSRAGRHAGARRGTSGEFEGYRPYTPGDPIDQIDPKVWVRLRQRVVRESREDSGTPSTVVVDRSGSMHSDLRDAAVASLLFFFRQLAHEAGDSVRTFILRDGEVTPWRNPPLATTESIRAALGREACRGETEVRRAFLSLPPDPAGRGPVIVISDGFGLTSPARDLAPLTRVGTPIWIAPLTPDEWAPSARGRVRLRSREEEPDWSGEIDAEQIERYRRHLRRYHDAIDRQLRLRGGHFIATDTDDPVNAVVDHLRRCGEFVG